MTNQTEYKPVNQEDRTPSNQEVAREPRWYKNIFSYTRTSAEELNYFEESLFSCIKSVPNEKKYVDIEIDIDGIKKKKQIWTVVFNKYSVNTPLLLIHGLGGAVGVWLLNYDELCTNRPVYAIDMLGFGRSSRCKMSKNPETCEKQYTESIEKWREQMNLKEFILLGHSMGGFLSCSYTMSYPQHVKHLILADPWGMAPAQAPDNILGQIIIFLYKPFNPYAGLRIVGPFGRKFAFYNNRDIIKKYQDMLEKDKTLISAYLHQCNAKRPTGERAFRNLSKNLKWAKKPMVDRMHEEIEEDIPITFLNAGKSFLYDSGLKAAKKIEALRADSFVRVQEIAESGHHIYGDQYAIFNQMVVDICNNSV